MLRYYSSRRIPTNNSSSSSSKLLLCRSNNNNGVQQQVTKQHHHLNNVQLSSYCSHFTVSRRYNNGTTSSSSSVKKMMRLEDLNKNNASLLVNRRRRSIIGSSLSPIVIQKSVAAVAFSSSAEAQQQQDQVVVEESASSTDAAATSTRSKTDKLSDWFKNRSKTSTTTTTTTPSSTSSSSSSSSPSSSWRDTLDKLGKQHKEKVEREKKQQQQAQQQTQKKQSQQQQRQPPSSWRDEIIQQQYNNNRRRNNYNNNWRSNSNNTRGQQQHNNNRYRDDQRQQQQPSQQQQYQQQQQPSPPWRDNNSRDGHQRHQSQPSSSLFFSNNRNRPNTSSLFGSNYNPQQQQEQQYQHQQEHQPPNKSSSWRDAITMNRRNSNNNNRGAAAAQNRNSASQQQQQEQQQQSSTTIGDNSHTDVSALRQAFLKTLQIDRTNKLEKEKEREDDSYRTNKTMSSLQRQQYQRPPPPPINFNSSWRNNPDYHTNRSSTKDFRNRQQQHNKWQERQTARNSWRQQRHQNHLDWLARKEKHDRIGQSFLKTADDYNEKDDEDSKKKKKSKSKGYLQRIRQQDTTRQKIELEYNHEPISIPQFANTLRVSRDSVIKTLKDLGEISRRADDSEIDNYRIKDIDMMELIVLELGIGEPVRVRSKRINTDDRSLLLQRRAASEEDSLIDDNGELIEEEATSAVETTSQQSSYYESLPKRPPVVCIMGHVDHGKTTIMDSLRRRSDEQQEQQKGGGSNKDKSSKKKKKGKKFVAKTSNKNRSVGDVAGTEAGGITQVITAFQVSLLNNGEDGDDDADSSSNEEDKLPAVTFLDTPGHAAFKSMRESGSHAADVIVLVVAADDGVSPQTVEIIDFYKSIILESGSSNAISLVVAMNKIDKPGIDVDECKTKIENQLLEHGIVTEGMDISSDYMDEQQHVVGPPVQLVPVSGLTGDGLDELIEGLVLQSEIMDLRADNTTRGEGIVMDAKLEKGLGVVADCIVRWGSMKRGDLILSGTSSGKIKILKDFNNSTLDKGIPSQPIRIIGFDTLPKAGSPLICVESENMIDKFIQQRKQIENTTNTTNDITNDDADAEIQITGTKAKNARMTEMSKERFGRKNDFDYTSVDHNNDSTTNTTTTTNSNKAIRVPVIIKADADGTLAAVRDSLVKIGDESSKYNINIDPIEESIGPVLASDIAMAKQSNATIYTFNLKGLNTDRNMLNLAEKDGIQIRNHDVIYALLDDAKDIITQKYIPPTPIIHVHGSATIQAIFDITTENKTIERIAGLKVDTGTLYKDKANVDWNSSSSNEEGDTNKADCYYRVIRNGKQIIPPLPPSSSSQSSETNNTVVDDKNGARSIRASSLKRMKDDVNTVRQGTECGLGLFNSENSNNESTVDYQAGDIIECYSIEMKRTFV